MENLTPEQISNLSREELSMKLMECAQHTKEQAAQTAEIVAKYEKTLAKIDNGIQTARRTLAQASNSEMRFKIKQTLDELLATRREIKAGLNTARAALRDARQTDRDTRDSASLRRWMKRLEEEKENQIH